MNYRRVSSPAPGYTQVIVERRNHRRPFEKTRRVPSSCALDMALTLFRKYEGNYVEIRTDFGTWSYDPVMLLVERLRGVR